MEIKKIYLIFEDNTMKKEDIDIDLKAEGYPHIFCFGKNVADKDKKFHISVSDEVWVFRNCEDILDYKIAVELGKDIWRMA